MVSRVVDLVTLLRISDPWYLPMVFLLCRFINNCVNIEKAFHSPNNQYAQWRSIIFCFILLLIFNKHVVAYFQPLGCMKKWFIIISYLLCYVHHQWTHWIPLGYPQTQDTNMENRINILSGNIQRKTDKEIIDIKI